MLRKQYIAKIETDDDERTVTAVISTITVDRDKEVLLSKGANFENYLKNPVVLWAHNYDEPPIARTLWMKASRNKITAKSKFAETEKAEEIYQLFKGGFLKAFSVGFLPAENGSHPPTPDEVKKHPEWAEARRIYDKWELLEYSPVPVPANPEALATAVKSKGILLSKETQDELGIEEDEVFYATESVSDEKDVDTSNKTDTDKIGSETENKPEPITTSPIIKTFPYIKVGKLQRADPRKVAEQFIKRMKGKMY